MPLIDEPQLCSLPQISKHTSNFSSRKITFPPQRPNQVKYVRICFSSHLQCQHNRAIPLCKPCLDAMCNVQAMSGACLSRDGCQKKGRSPQE